MSNQDSGLAGRSRNANMSGEKGATGCQHAFKYLPLPCWSDSHIIDPSHTNLQLTTSKSSTRSKVKGRSRKLKSSPGHDLAFRLAQILRTPYWMQSVRSQSVNRVSHLLQNEFRQILSSAVVLRRSQRPAIH